MDCRGPESSRLLPRGIEERPFHDAGRRALPFPLDRDLHLELRALRRVPGAAGREDEVPLEEGRPRAARRPPDLPHPRVHGDVGSPGEARGLRGEALLVEEPLRPGPVDLEPDDPPGGTPTGVLPRGPPADETALVEGDGPTGARTPRRVALGVDEGLPRGE